jgi:stage II sporulation protein M
MKYTSRWKDKIISFIRINIREYSIVALLFLIGIFFGVMIINNCDYKQIEEVSNYINDFIEEFKSTNRIENGELVLNSTKNNIKLVIILWLSGTAVIGIPIVLLIIFLRGMFLGYTVSAITYTCGTFKGIIFCIISILFQNILFIPAILTLGVSSIKLYQTIIKDRRKDSIKYGILKHTKISLLMLIILIISSLVEDLVSMPILQNWIKYF